MLAARTQDTRLERFSLGASLGQCCGGATVLLFEPMGQPQAGAGMALAASIKVLSGAAAGKSVTLTKVVTTVGKPGVQVASITKRPTGYVLAHVEGAQRPSINGVTLVTDTAPLSNGDLIELAGTQMQFVHG
jgi:xanthine/CO dehydrogenase XdhC/CoxF family maturation factor